MVWIMPCCKRIAGFQILAIALLVTCTGCSSNTRSNIAAAVSVATASSAPSSKMMLFGGENHKTYLGCLSCSQYATDSLFNTYGDHGNRYSSDSIWNHYSDYGSRYSNEGACNPYANDPPVIVDSDGTFYGRLTLNIYHPQIGAGARYHSWLATTVCEE